MKKVEVDPTKSQLFSSTIAIETFLVERAVSQIKEIVQEAGIRAEVFAARVKEDVVFTPDVRISAELNKESSNDQESASDTVVDLGDGTVARLKM
jgi:hypothetical protein